MDKFIYNSVYDQCINSDLLQSLQNLSIYLISRTSQLLDSYKYFRFSEISINFG